MNVEKRFCTTCQSYKLDIGGSKEAGSFRGWRCAPCLEKRTMSIYIGKKALKRIKEQTA